jgi:hypothetical protein
VITPVTITGTFTNPDGSPTSGAIMFQLVDASGNPSGMVDSVTGQMVVPMVAAGIVHNGKLLWNAPGGGGYLPLVLLANDNATTLPTGTMYQVTENLAVPPSEQVAPWQLIVHSAVLNATIDVSTQRPIPV